MLQNNTFLDSNFERIFFVLASENDGKIEQVVHFYRKHRFCKNHCFPYEKSLFFWLGASKNLSKLDAQTQWKIKSKKKPQKPNLESHLAFQNPWKRAPKAMWNKACFATLWKSRGTHRKSTGGIACKASKWLCIWLGLLDLPLVALIIKASSSTWNASHMSLQMRCGTQKNRFWRFKNHSKSELRVKIHPKSSSKAMVLERTPSNINFVEKIRFFDDFWIPKCI